MSIMRKVTERRRRGGEEGGGGEGGGGGERRERKEQLEQLTVQQNDLGNSPRVRSDSNRRVWRTQ